MVLTDVKSLRSCCVLIAWCIIISACATAPIQEMSDARQSLQAAYDAGAEKYASVTLHSAESALKQAENKLENRVFKEARLKADGQGRGNECPGNCTGYQCGRSSDIKGDKKR